MPPLRTLAGLVHQYGWRWLGYRGWLGAMHALGWESRRMPTREWPDPLNLQPAAILALLPPWELQAVQAFTSRYPEAGEALRSEADDILSGVFRKFELPGQPLGFPPIWNEELPGKVLPGRGTHWSRIHPHEDIKLAWELSRMGWAQVLARAYVLLGDERYAQAFWDLFEDWHRQNPPNHGAQWGCGQEAALRVLSLALAGDLLRSSPSSTPERLGKLGQVMQATGHRIEPHFHYARSQRNNHALNEALGLLTAGAWHPGGHEAARWLRSGSAAFAQDLLDQLDEEGSYIQHSTIYHRLMVHACTWRLLLAKALGTPVPEAVRLRMKAGLEWLFSLVEASTGEAPNLGSNDGANILRLATCAFSDHRPALQGLAALLEEPLPYPPGPWDEPVLWLTGRDPATLPRRDSPRQDLSAPGRGHHLRLYEEGSLYFRCASYRERPSQSDPLHVDLTWRGLNVLCDAGTYRYNAPPPWKNSLAFTGAHNTVTLGGRTSMPRLGPFLWLDWDRAEPVSAPQPGWLAGERRMTRTSPMRHRRTLFPLGPGHWVILDDVWSPRFQPFRLHWLLPDLPRVGEERGVTLQTPRGAFQLLVLGPGSLDLVLGGPAKLSTGAELPPRGWRSPCYLQLEPAISLSCGSEGSQQARWVSLAGEGPFTAVLQSTQLTLDCASGRYLATLPPPFHECVHAP